MSASLLPTIGQQVGPGTTSNPALLQSKISLIRDKHNASVNDLFRKGNGNSTLLPSRRSNLEYQYASSAHLDPHVQLPHISLGGGQRLGHRDNTSGALPYVSGERGAATMGP